MQKHALELASTPPSLGMDFIEEKAKPGDAAPALPAAYLVTELAMIDQPHDVRFCQREGASRRDER